jgi:hypothetical protein
MDKRGLAFNSSRTNFSLLAGVVCVIIGVMPLLPLLSINIPGLSSIDSSIYDVVVKVALFIGGLFLLYDSFQIRNMLTGRVKGASILAGLLVAVVGALPLALHFKLFDTVLPFVVQLSIPSGVWYGLLIFYGLYLVVDAYRIRQARIF